MPTAELLKLGEVPNKGVLLSELNKDQFAKRIGVEGQIFFAIGNQWYFRSSPYGEAKAVIYENLSVEPLPVGTQIVLTSTK